MYHAARGPAATPSLPCLAVPAGAKPSLQTGVFTSCCTCSFNSGHPLRGILKCFCLKLSLVLPLGNCPGHNPKSLKVRVGFSGCFFPRHLWQGCVAGLLSSPDLWPLPSSEAPSDLSLLSCELCM